jgi:serine/threonine protein kinase
MSARTPEYKAGDLLPGTKYRVVSQLGAGGMGIVYQVVKPPQIQGVLKLMTRELAQSAEFRTRFLDEVRVLAQLDHPNIVRVFDYDTLADGTPYFVMELLTGSTLRDVLSATGKLPARAAYEITRQLLDALQCAHKNALPVVHRDIKPENIFLHSPKHGDPVVKLIDFGVSALADRQHDGAFVGTWKYAAPEQIRGEQPSPATDLYAVGLVLYEMLTGTGPFDAIVPAASNVEATSKAIAHAHLQAPPPPLSKHAPWAPASVVDLVASALAKDPGRRPRDAHAFAERLLELEWAADGKDPRDVTIEGPLSQMMTSAALRTPARPSGSVPASPSASNVRRAGVPVDTFASQASSARGVPRSKAPLLVLAGAAGIVVLGMIAFVAILFQGRGDSHRTVATATMLPSASSVTVTSLSSAPPSVSATAAVAASSSAVAEAPTTSASTRPEVPQKRAQPIAPRPTTSATNHVASPATTPAPSASWHRSDYASGL